MKKKSNIYCVNCDGIGHLSKNCNIPITSYGIILLYFDNDSINEKLKNDIVNNFTNNNAYHKIDEPTGIAINGANDIELFCGLKNSIKFLLIRRKHTLGFLEFIRGRYIIDNIDGIIFLFKQMTPDEIMKIKTLSFDELWVDVWGSKQHKTTSPIYQSEYMNSKDKYNKLKNENISLNLNFYTDNVKPVWEFAEWGFPKGRRNIKERNIDCAIREFQEESGFDGNGNDFILLDNIEPIEETLIGTNGVNYRHIYYIAIANSKKLPKINPENQVQLDEIGDIKYMTYEDCIKMIRSHHIDRQKIITQIYIYFINYLISSINSLQKI
ncbi:NUDIX hydrolase [Indivirus ILV1]|uniref:NUDIX hydrolase n=1 Tax=Indivirus ILV1 TaxID=1977633 RepID=A0A1V0SDM2_9VIRU|nr:NUDIX hydrolase [Indivirus ILV1]